MSDQHAALYGHLDASRDVLARLVEEPMDIPTALMVRKSVRAVQTALVEFDQLKAELINKFGEDGAVPPDSPNFAKAVKALDELMSQPVEFDVQPLPLDKMNGFKVSMRELVALEAVGLLSTKEETNADEA